MNHIIQATFVFLLLVSCGNSKKQQQQEISRLDNELKKEFKEDLALQLVDACDRYRTAYPDDAKSKDYLFMSANTLVSLKNGTKAIRYFDEFLKLYKNDPRIPSCLFTKALTYDTVLNDKDQAIKYYTDFISAYPRHELADDAQNAILLLRDPMDLIRRFEAGNDSLKR